MKKVTRAETIKAKMTRRDQKKPETSDEDSDQSVDEKNGYNPPVSRHRNFTQPRQLAIQKLEESDDEEPSNEVIEIDSDDSQDGMTTTNNNESSKNEQNNNRDSDRESTSSDIVVVSDDYQKFNEEIEKLSKIESEDQLHPEDKVSKKNFKIHTLLGTGAYGKVFLVEKLDGMDKGHLYAMKVLEKNKVTQKKKTTEHTRTEREVLEKVIDCPFLATLYYAFQTAEKLYLVMEFVQGGELFSHLYRSEHFQEDQVRFYIAEIIVALEQLHEFNIIYRDIKLENILLDADGHIIITDFGLSKILTDNVRAMSYCGTIEYMAPEIVNPNGIGHDRNVDWWSVGVLIVELLSGQSPFSREGEDSNQQLISDRIQNQDPNIPASIGKIAKDLILKLLEKDPRKRLGYRGAEQLKNHNFFHGIKWDILKEKRYNAPMKPPLKGKFDVSQFSEDFTKQPAEDGPAESGPLTAPNGKNFFRGYSYVVPKLRRKREEPSIRLQEMSITEHPPEMNRPRLRDVFRVQNKKNSKFFKKYRISTSKEPLGDGTYSLCMECVSLSTKQRFAVKIMKIDHDASKEIEALRKCQDHKNIVTLVETLQDDYFNYIVFELLNGGELFSRIRESGFLAENVAHSYFQKIVDAVVFMHSKGIIHKDLKPENILFVDESIESNLRIVDFGFAQRGSSEESPPCFTLDYASPESLVKGETKPSRDLWSLGVILYTMLCGNTPFKPISNEQDERNFRMQVTENIRSGHYNMENIRWAQISNEAKDLIMKLIKVNESERISLKEILGHPWLSAKFDSRCYGSESIRRSGSEETIAHEDDDDAIVINDDDFGTENRDETRSNDDSSSGIVMSDRNEGSSVSHEEIDPSGHIFENNEEDMIANSNMIVEEQMEPENLSLKESNKPADKLVEEEPIIVINEEIPAIEEEEVALKKSISKSRSKKGRPRAAQKSKRKPQQFPLDLHVSEDPLPLNLMVNSVTEQLEDFAGFEQLEDDNNFPLFGFPSEKNDLLSRTIAMFEKLFNAQRKESTDEKVLTVIKGRRGRKGKKGSKTDEPKVQQKKPSAKRKIQTPAAKLEPPPKRIRPVRACVHREPQIIDVKVQEPTIQPLKVNHKRGRPKKDKKELKTELIDPKQTKKVGKNEPQDKIFPVVRKTRGKKKLNEVEALLQSLDNIKQPSSNIDRSCKRKFLEKEEPKTTVIAKKRVKKEEPKMPAIAEKKKTRKLGKVESLPNIRMTRKAQKKADTVQNIPYIERFPFIKPEFTHSAMNISFQEPRMYEMRTPKNLAPKFRERISSIRNWYVDNKEQPSKIPSRFVKPEPVERATVQYR